MQELRRLALKRVPDELENPPDHEKRESVDPQAMKEESRHEDSQRHQDGGYA